MTADTPSRTFSSPVTVRSYELDALGHVNNAVYLNYLEYSRFNALASGGFPLAEMERRQWAVHVVRIEVDYRRECRFEDRLLVRTGVERFRNSSMILRQELHRFPPEVASTPLLERLLSAPRELDPDTDLSELLEQGEAALSARIVAVWVGPDGRPMRIPDEVRDALAPPASSETS
jgi:thioesterase III